MILCLTLLLLILAGCQEGEPSPTPTPFGSLGSQTTSNLGPVVPVTITELAANPAFYAGALLEVTGQYKRQPQIVCDGTAYPSPVAYGLRQEQLLAYATGYEEQIRALLPDGITLTVVGEWTYWRGPVGCGKQAQMQELWYLAVDQIVAPNPLVKMTMTPSIGVITQATLTPTPPTAEETAVFPPDETETPPSTEPPAEGEPTETATPTATTTAIDDDDKEDPTETPTPTGTTDLSAPVTATPMPDATDPSGSTATPTPAGTLTPTATSDPSAPSTPTPSPTPTTASTSPTIITKEELMDEEPVGDSLGSNETHSWTITASASEAVTIYLAAGGGVTAKVALLDSNNNLLTDANTSGTNNVAKISAYTLTSAGTYKVNVSSSNGAPADYALLILYDGSYEYVLQGFLAWGDSETVSLTADTDHYWAFAGESGDTINLTVGAQGGASMFVEVWFEGSKVTDGTNITQVLSGSGVYFVWIGEEDYNSATYTVALSGN